MDQHSCLSTTGSRRYHDTTRVFVRDNLHLFFGKHTKNMLIFLGCDISFYLTDTFTFEIFLHKPFIIHLEVILHIL